MAKGSIAKQSIIQKILDTFEGAFIGPDGKELRIPFVEDGVQVEIKVALTCAKENIGGGAAIAQPVAVDDNSQTAVVAEPTAEELDNVKKIMEKLNL